jgi:ABC-type histidine transport system ATPase subunit
MKAVTMLRDSRFIGDLGSGKSCYYDSRHKLIRTRLSGREQSFNLAFEMFINESKLESKAIVFVVDDGVSMRESLENLIRSVGLRVEVFAYSYLGDGGNLRLEMLFRFSLIWQACSYRSFSSHLWAC